MSFHDAKHAWTGAHFAHDPLGDTNARAEIDPNYAADLKLCKDVWEVLQRHYPSQPWHVQASSKAGMVQIFLPTFSTWSYNIRMADMKADPGMKLVMKGAGELLERFKLPRAGFDYTHYVAAQLAFKPLFNINRRPPD